jgi:uncharacterized protein
MLLEYSVQNYKTFKDRVVLSLIASNYEKKGFEDTNVSKISMGLNELRVLKTATIHGANASGKTKLFESLALFRDFIINSSKDSQKGDSIFVVPFILSEETENKSSEFELIFYYKNAVYRYGFEATKTQVIAEWLFYRPNKPKAQELRIFDREAGEPLDYHKSLFKIGARIYNDNMVRNNALLISVAAQFNDEWCGNVLDWFRTLSTISSIHDQGFSGFTMMKMENNNYHKKIMNLLKSADLSIKEVKSLTMEVDDIPADTSESIKMDLIKKIQNEKITVFTDSATTHNKYDAENNIIGTTQLLMDEDESHGTQKFFYLTGPIISALENGHTLIIDEFDARLHPNLVVFLFNLFNDLNTNTTNAQLIITSHNPILLKPNMLRKDQVWFIDKDKYEVSHLYSLADFKADVVRKSENYESNYLDGKYNAIPYLRHFDQYFGEDCKKDDA